MRRSWWILLLAALSLAVHAWRGGDHTPQRPDELDPGEYRVERVVDGDTLLLPGDVYVRLIGVDTPETVRPNHPVEPFGPEATAFTREAIGHARVRLEFGRERTDKYGRVLAYVWIGREMLNEQLLRAGLARAETGYRYDAETKRRFLAAQQEARQARRGLWSQ